MSTPQDQTREQLSAWTSTQTAERYALFDNVDQSPAVTEQTEQMLARYEHVIGYDPDQRLLAASDTIDEVLDWNSGRGHLIVTGPGLPVSALNSLALLGFPPAEIEAAIVERIDEDGNLTTEDIVAATAELTGVPGTEDAFLQTIHDRATSREALQYAEDSAYYDESERVDALPLPDLLAETGHPDLASAREAMAEARGFVSYDHLDQVLEEVEWDDTTTELYRSMTPTERALWEAREPVAIADADQDDLSAAFPEFDQASSQDASYFAEQAGDVDDL
jgi:hypothetical protein